MGIILRCEEIVISWKKEDTGIYQSDYAEENLGIFRWSEEHKVLDA